MIGAYVRQYGGVYHVVVSLSTGGPVLGDVTYYSFKVNAEEHARQINAAIRNPVNMNARRDK